MKERFGKSDLQVFCIASLIIDSSCFFFCQGISSHAQYVTPQKCFSSPTCLLFPNPTYIKLKLGQQIGGRLLIANHLDKSLWLVNQKQAPAVRSYLYQQYNHIHYTLLWRALGVRLSCAFHQRPETVQKYWGKTIFLSGNMLFLSETSMFRLLFIQF
jgi:hypothetical protein